MRPKFVRMMVAIILKVMLLMMMAMIVTDRENMVTRLILMFLCLRKDCFKARLQNTLVSKYQ